MELIWPIKWHKRQWPWMTPKFTLAIWHYLTHLLANITHTNFDMCTRIKEHTWPVTLNELEGHSSVSGLFKCKSSTFVQQFTKIQLARSHRAVPQRQLGFLFVCCSDCGERALSSDKAERRISDNVHTVRHVRTEQRRKHEEDEFADWSRFFSGIQPRCSGMH